MKVHHHEHRKGFTLMELLAVLGIIAIVLAVAIPSLLLHQRDLKLTELDDNARAVFMAAQNHLTALRSASAGELDVSAAAGRGALPVPVDALDFTVEGSESGLMYVSTNVSGADPDWLVLPGSIEEELSSEDSCYLVEFDPVSGAVYGVFFMERNGSQGLDEDAYKQLYSFASSGGNSCRVREGRNAFARAEGGFLVGYYGADGKLGVIRPDSLKLPTPKLKLINAEELVLEINTDSWPASIDQSKVFATVSVTDASGAGKTLVKKGAIQSGTTARVVLDTLKSSKTPKTALYDRGDTQTTSGWTVGDSFDQWMSIPSGGYTITPGADVNVTVSIWYQPGSNESLVALPQTASVTTNSLFAARSDEQVEIAYGRHLQNLGAEGVDSTITSAVQTRAIDFAKAKPVGANAIYYWAETYNHAGWPFVPINNGNLKSYDGMGLAIRNLNAVKDEGIYENAGLFGTFSGSELKNVVLEDAQVKGNNAGALAGFVKNATVDGCQAYITPADDGTYSTDVRIEAANAGGLIGDAFNCTIQGGSFASTVVDGSTAAGGLLGSSANLKVNRCYAAGYLSGKTVGGLVGAGNAKIENCYAAGTIYKASSMAAGLITNSNDVDNSYAAVEYVDVAEADKVYGAAPKGSGCTNVYYLVKPGVNDGGVGTAVSSADDMKLGKTLSVLNPAGEEPIFAEGGNDDAPAYPYNLPNQPDNTREPTLAAPYPYPTLAGLDHYGDWLSASGDSVLAYYEKYDDGAYGFYFEKQVSGGTETVDELRNGASVVVVEDGYGVLSTAEPSVSASDASVTATQVDGVEYSMDGKAYNFYTLDGNWILNNHGYCQVSVGGRSVWVDPDFAKTASLTEKTTAETAYTVRTVRQLDNIDQDLYASADKVFTQELTIDGGTYVGAVYGKAAGDWRAISAQYSAAPFAATFDGARDKGFMIRDLTITGAQTAGLFAQIGPGATVRNVALASVNVSSTYNWGDLNVGGLAGVISGGTVTNSGVYVADASGETVGADYDAYRVATTDWYKEANAGGFAGSITGGTVSKCFAAVKVGGYGNSGGFAGAISGGTVSDCYAAGHTVNGVFPVPGGNVRGNVSTGEVKAGGFVANWTGGDITGTCYATVSVEGQWGAASVGAFAAAYPAGVTLPDCYARSYVYQNGALVNPTDVDTLGLDKATYTGTKATAHPYDDTIGTEYDFKPIDGLDHYGDWSLKKLRGLVAYYEQVELPRVNAWDPVNLKTEFFYYDRVKQGGDYVLEEKGTMTERTGTLYSDGYAFLSLNRLHQEGETAGAQVKLKVDIGGTADLAGMSQYDTTYLGAFNIDLTPFVEKWDGTKPFYYAYALPNAALDGAVAAEDYFLQLKVAGLDSEVELDSLWINPHFGLTAYNGYGETNPSKGDPKIPIPDGTGDVIPIRSARQFNNMRKYRADIKSWNQELDIDASQYKGHPSKDSEGYLTVGGLRVTTKQADGTWQLVATSSEKPTVNDLPATYRLSMDPITMESRESATAPWKGKYNGNGFTISNLSIGVFEDDSKYYAGLFSRSSNDAVIEKVNLSNCDVVGSAESGTVYAGALLGHARGTISNCTVLNTSVTSVAKTGYTGGFAGYVQEATIENCGVRVEGTNADSLYNTCAVSGTGNVGGFTGYQSKGTIQHSYASVKVKGGVAGGFIGTLKEGTIHNCYAGGHTKNHTYVAGIGNANVDGSRAGGFICDWNGGKITGTCYTTCSVNATKTELVGTFARKFPSGKTLPDCYASGFVYVAGVRNSAMEGSGALGLGSKGLTGTPAAASPYDPTLPKQYTDKPTTDAAGAPMTHYGDWKYKPPRTGFEWDPIPEVFKPVDRGESLQTLEADWNGNSLNLNFTTIGSGTTLANLFAPSGGNFAITSDLGYVKTYLVENTGNDASVRVTDGDGNTWEITPEIVGYTQPTPEELAAGKQPQPIRSYKLTIPTKNLPAYLRTINVGGYKEGYIASDIPNTDPSASDYKPKEEFLPGDSVSIDGSFDDWTGYRHQLLAFTPGNAATSGSAMGAAFGEGNEIYVHAVNNYTPNLVPADYSGNLTNIPVTNFNISVVGDDQWNSRDYEWWRFTGQTYAGPGTYKLVSWQGTEYMECYLTVREDGSQEMEMNIHLEAMTGSKEIADKISKFTINFGTIAGSLTIERDLDKE